MVSEIDVYKTLVWKREGKTYLDDLSIDGNIKLRTKAKGWVSLGWLHLANSAEMWRAVVNTVMNFRDRHNARKFLTETESASQEDSAVWSH